MKTVLLAPIRLVSLVFRSLGMRACRFHPTCSEYAAQAMASRPAGTALVLTAKRFIRCHPFSAGGYDPVPEASDNVLLFKES
jgi:putative membrane protein insertion efficiency factor